MRPHVSIRLSLIAAWCLLSCPSIASAQSARESVTDQPSNDVQQVASPSDVGAGLNSIEPLFTGSTPDTRELAHDSSTLIAGITIFVLAVVVGFEVIAKVPPTLHTPLMSGSNAISGITLVGALLSTGSGHTDLAALLGFVAVILATINVVGGFAVTDRMLGMFRRG